MAKFVYTVDLPVSKQTVQLTEISYVDFKTVVKNITNEDNNVIFKTFNEVLKQYCIEDTGKLSIVDKLYILLTIRAVCISPVLELVVTCPRTKEQFNTTINIDDILAILRNSPLKEKTISYNNNLKITYDLPTSLYINLDI